MPEAPGRRGEEQAECLVPVILVARVGQRQRTRGGGQRGRVGGIQGRVADGEQQPYRTRAGEQRRLTDCDLRQVAQRVAGRELEVLVPDHGGQLPAERVSGQQLVLAVQVAGVPGGPARGGVAARDGPAPLQEQGVDVRQPAVPGVADGQVVPGFAQVPVGLEEDDVAPGAEKAVDEGPSVAAPAVGSVGDARAEEPPEAVADSHRVTHQPPPIISPSSPLEARQSRAICGVPQIGLPLTLREVLISTGTPVRSAKRRSTSARKGVLARS